MTPVRRLAVVTIALIASMTLSVTPSLAGKSDASVTVLNHLGLVDPSGIAAHGKYVWVSQLRGGSENGEVVRVNALSDAHVSITSPLINHPWNLVSDGSYVWVVNRAKGPTGTAFISRLDIATNTVSFVTGVTSVNSLAIGGNYVWVSGVAPDSILRVNRTTLSTTHVTSKFFDEATALSADRHYVWVACDGGGPLKRGSLARISLRTGAITEVNSPYFDDPVTVTSNGTGVWMSASNHVVVKVDIATDKVSKVSSKSFVGALWIGSTSREVYALSLFGSATAHGALTQINGVTGSLHVITSKYFVSPFGLAVLGSHVWTINSPVVGTTAKYPLVRVTP